MSRIAKAPVVIPAGVEVKLEGQNLTVKGSKTSLSLNVNPAVKVTIENNEVKFAPVDESKNANAQSGTVRALVHNMVNGVQNGYSRALKLVGVGYRAQVKGKTVVLNLGFSNPVEYQLPEGITAEMPAQSQTDLIIKGADRDLVGQVASEIRAVRSPEPYKGKGVRYSDEIVHLKEAKKK